MGPESILIFSLSILVVRGNSAAYTNTELARKNLHGEAKPSHPHLTLLYKSDNGPYEEEADPKIASIASAAADATLDITKALAKEISDAIAFAVADAVAKVLAEQSIPSRMDSDKLPKDIPVASDEVKSNSNVKHDSKYGNIEYREFSIRRSQQEQPEVAYEDDNESWPADNTNKFSKLSEADESKIEQRIYGDNQTPVLNQDLRIDPNVNYEGSGVIILHRRNNSEPIYHRPRNAGHHNHQPIDIKQDDDDFLETEHRTVLGSHRKKDNISRNTNVIHFEPNGRYVNLDPDEDNDVNNYRRYFSRPNLDSYHSDDVKKTNSRRH